ncbi:MAG: hypothetical protein ACR2N8_01085 [Parvibaculales bacterium]
MRFFARLEKATAQLRHQDLALIAISSACFGVVLLCLFPLLIAWGWENYLALALFLWFFPYFTLRANRPLHWYEISYLKTAAMSSGLLLAVWFPTLTEAGWSSWLILSAITAIFPAIQYFRNL